MHLRPVTESATTATHRQRHRQCARAQDTVFSFLPARARRWTKASVLSWRPRRPHSLRDHVRRPPYSIVFSGFCGSTYTCEDWKVPWQDIKFTLPETRTLLTGLFGSPIFVSRIRHPLGASTYLRAQALKALNIMWMGVACWPRSQRESGAHRSSGFKKCAVDTLRSSGVW